MLDLRRREFITLLGGAATWPLAARAQRPVVPVIGYLGVGALPAHLLAVFKQGLAEAAQKCGQWARPESWRPSPTH